MSIPSSSPESRGDEKMPDRMGTTSWPSPPSESVPTGPTRVDVSTGRKEASGSAATRFAFLTEARGPDELGWLGPYRIRGVLGEGGMGVVFDAEDSQLCRRVALKILKPELARTPQLCERFLQEARAAAALPPEHVVAIYHVGSEGDVPYLAMQYLEGESLEKHLRRAGRLSTAEAARLGREIALGLSVAHEKGLIHRDIKPANIWLEAAPSGSAPRVKLLDFGLARVVGGVSNLTASGRIVGTPHYMAPEQARGQTLDSRCDLFSLGCVLYRAVTGVTPFDGPDLLSLLTSLAVDEPRSIHELAPDAPAELVDLIHQLLSKSPSERPASAQVVAERLRRLGSAPSLDGDFHPAADAAGSPTRRTGSVRCWVDEPAVSATGSGKGGPNRFGTGLLIGSLLASIVLVLAAWSWIKIKTQPASANIDCSLQGHPIPVGVLQTLSGPLASGSASTVEAIKLAIDEINDQGGVLGSRIEPTFVDGSPDESGFADTVNRLILENHVCALFGCCSSSGRRNVLPVVAKYNHLLLYPLPCAGGQQSPNIVYTGTAASQLILPSLQFATGTLRKRRLFLIGSDNSYSHSVHTILSDALAESRDVRLIGKAFYPLGVNDFKDAAAKVRASNADLILNTIGGDASVSFFRALRAAGITPEKTPTLCFGVGENTFRTLPVDHLRGDYAAGSFFQSLNRPESTAFIHKFHKRYGDHRIVTDAMESAYVALHLWARAATEAGDTQPAAVRAALRGLQTNGPGGPVRIDADSQYAWRVVRIAQIGERGQFKIMWSSEEPVPPQSKNGVRSFFPDKMN